MAKKLAIKDAAPFGVFEVANKSGERAMGGKDAILDTVSAFNPPELEKRNVCREK